MNTLIVESEIETTTSTSSDELFPSTQELPAKEDPICPAEEKAIPQDSRILRFHVPEKMLHWAIATPYMICAVTGLILLAFFDLRAAGTSRALISWLHRIGGLGLMILPALSVLKSRRDYHLHLKNVRHACTWTMNDFKWVVLAGPAALSRKIKLPDQHKFNAAEKVNFIVGLCTYPLFILTGVLLWLPGTNFLAWIIHVGIALLAVPLVVGHIYMALINPSTRPGLSGMFSGYVDREWAKHHYRTWYQENFEEVQARPEKEARTP
jgi:formate dehydrogenase subunit gamma